PAHRARDDAESALRIGRSGGRRYDLRRGGHRDGIRDRLSPGDHVRFVYPLRPMRILHTMIRVGDLVRSIEFYVNALGMKLLRQRDFPDGKFTLTFLGYGPEDSHPAIELTYNYGVSSYELGTAFGHIAIG